MATNVILLATVLAVVSPVIANGPPFASNTLEYRTWKRSVKACDGNGHCFLPWAQRYQGPSYRSDFILDYKKERLDGFLVPCPAFYKLSDRLGLDPFRMCYPLPEMETMLAGTPNNCLQNLVSHFGFYPEPVNCSPKDPCFIDRRFALRVVNASVNSPVATPNATFIVEDSVTLSGYSAIFHLYSNANSESRCAIVDGFQQFDVIVMFAGEKMAINASVSPIQVTTQDYRGRTYTHPKYVVHPVKYNISILTTCTTSLRDCGLQRTFSDVNNTIAARQLPFAEFNKELAKSRPDDACVPFRTPFGVRGLFCVEYDGQTTLFSTPKTLMNLTADKFDALQAQQKVQQHNIELFLW
ncbi:hypothetical protein AAVH_24865 [Aphelenchoides avenae]|nr:hypothetical protein AAVH_24865 [Aphelenchus avenae]